MIKIEHLRKEYPNVTPLKDVSVEINKGDVISIGEVITDPKCDISLIRRKMGMVFQSFNAAR